jgi:hypothetical protein
MSDKNYDDQDEYRYSDDEQSGATPTRDEPQETNKKDESVKAKAASHSRYDLSRGKSGLDALLKRIKQLPFLQSKRSIIIIVAVVVLFLLIKLIGGHGNSNPSFPKKAQKQAQSTTVPVNENKLMMAQMRELASQSVQNKRNVTVLTRNMQQMQQSMQSINDVVVQLTDEVTNLTQQVKQLQASPSHGTAAEKNGQISSAPKLKIYHITAMVPGRAWVKSEGNSQAVTVRIGDELPTYGKVVSIDSDNGVVATESGRMIQFGDNDS